jgi:XTP/dITP diphosphohydrolase
MININRPLLLIASTNPGKLREIADILEGFPGQLILPADLGIQLSVEETGETYRENAALKARAYCKASGQVTLADDSGLEVDALDGKPGLHSARYVIKPGATDADRRGALLENLKGKPRPWTARFRCSVAVVSPNGKLEFFDGHVEGEIWPEERGANGFGYDPIFYLPNLGRTMAELTDSEKNHLSHRGIAVEKARPVLERLLIIKNSP